MARRYLTPTEAGSALRRGKLVEVFLGGFEFQGNKCIRWASFALSETGVSGSLWEAYDQGSEDYVDIYSFSPVSGEYDEPTEVVHSEDLIGALNALGIAEPKLVNQGVVQDEYIDYLKANGVY